MRLQPLDLLQSPSETKQKYHQALQISSYPSFRASEAPQSDQSHKNEGRVTLIFKLTEGRGWLVFISDHYRPKESLLNPKKVCHLYQTVCFDSDP